MASFGEFDASSNKDNADHAENKANHVSRTECASTSSATVSAKPADQKPESSSSLGNIVDYPITPESSEEEEAMETESTNTVKDQEPHDQSTISSEERQFQSQVKMIEAETSKEQEKAKSEQVSGDDDMENNKTNVSEESQLPSEVSVGDIKDTSDSSKSSLTNITSSQPQENQEESMSHQIVSDIEKVAAAEQVSEKTLDTPSSDQIKPIDEKPCESTNEKTTKPFQSVNEDAVKPSEYDDDHTKKSPTPFGSVAQDTDKPFESVSTKKVDDETASQGSAEFEPNLESGEGEKQDKPKFDEESMDVEGEESNQEMISAVGTPAAASDVDVGTPIADADAGTPLAADIEDEDSLLPDREVQKPVAKSGSFPITAAFMDENSLSLDCVLGMSSTVPMGDDSIISMDSKDGPTAPKRSRPASALSGVEPEEDDGSFPAERLFEYQWPTDGGEWYMLQEQISEYLQVKSFKRKYPDLFRRTCDKNEKDFLRERGVVTEQQSDLGLTAIKSEEVYDLMHKDYAEKYRVYAHVLHEKERQNINNKHKEYEVPKLDKNKMGAYIKKAVKAAADFNAQFQRERREERRAYFDLQTFMIQYPQGRHKKLGPEATKTGPYPVALIPGQFQNYYCKYTAAELKYLPLNTAMFDPPKKWSNMLPKPGTEEDTSEAEDNKEEKAGSGSDGESDDGSSDSDDSDSDAAATQDDTAAKEEVLAVPLVEEKCRICNSADPPPPEKTKSRGKKGKQKEVAVDDSEMVKCSECGTFGHPSCLDLTNAMVAVIRTYPWQCMECKTCVECMDPYDEDKMMFCDRCDRGYHTFCVGLRSIPTGNWECRSCKGTTDTPRARKRASLAK